MLKRILDRISPARICRREGHQFRGFETMGPHLNRPEVGRFGGVFYGLRYVIRCRRCNRDQFDTEGASTE